jgi:hypothetical protein
MNLKSEIEKELEYCNERLQYIDKLMNMASILDMVKSNMSKDYINLKHWKIDLLRMLTDLEIHSEKNQIDNCNVGEIGDELK